MDHVAREPVEPGAPRIFHGDMEGFDGKIGAAKVDGVASRWALEVLPVARTNL